MSLDIRHPIFASQTLRCNRSGARCTRLSGNAARASSTTPELHLDNKITIARSPLKRTRSAQEQNDLEEYLRHIGSSALYNFSEFESLVRATRIMTLAIAVALPQDGRLVALEKDANIAAFGAPYWEQAHVMDKIDLRIGRATDSLSKLLKVCGQHYFDVAFIDADKVNYEAYYDLCLQLIKPGGVILFDNTLWGGRVTLPEFEDANTQAIRKLNSRLLKDDRVFVSVLANADGLSLVVKKK